MQATTSNPFFFFFIYIFFQLRRSLLDRVHELFEALLLGCFDELVIPS